MSAVWQNLPCRNTPSRRRGVGAVLGVVALSGLLAGCPTRDVDEAPAVPPGHGHAAIPPGAPAPAANPAALASTRAIDLKASTDVPGLIERIADQRVIYLGERHDRYEQHLLQLDIVRRLRERGVPVAIGMEQFQRRFQPALDDFLAGRIDTRELLRRSEYYQRWRFDYRLYRPILEYARAQGIPVVALNAEVELTRRVGQVGLGGLASEERAALPAEYGPAEAPYRATLRAVFDAHPDPGERDFEHFVEVQLSWDETMAERAARYLAEHPERHLVVLVGAGHVVDRHGIPDRLQRRLPVADAVVLLGDEPGVGADSADWMLLPEPVELPPSGKLGIFMVDSEQGVRVADVLDDGTAAQAGVKTDDILLELDGVPLQTTADVRIALFERAPGERLALTVRRGGETVSMSVALRAH